MKKVDRSDSLMDAVEGWTIPVRRYKVMVTTDVIEGLDITALDCVRIVPSLG